MPAFPIAPGSRGQQPQEDWEYLTVNSNPIVLLAPHQDETKQGRKCNHSTWCLDDPWARFHLCVASRTCLVILSWDILDTWPNQRSWDLSIRRSGSKFRALRISQLRSLSQSVFTSCTLRKIPSLPLVLGKVFFQSLPGFFFY